jgi:phosphate transport system protein
MGTAGNKHPGQQAYDDILGGTLRACESARAAAAAAAQVIADPERQVKAVSAREEELDTLDREINEGVTATISQVSPERARELLACLKFIIELERIGDLFLSFANRANSVSSRIDPQDAGDLVTMARQVERMLADDYNAFRNRDVNLAVKVMRYDAEIDRLRNLIFMRHVENPEAQPRQESFHVLFMAQSLERAGDHAKNLAEEVCQLVTGRSIRHLLRASDKPFEVMFMDFMRKREATRR